MALPTDEEIEAALDAVDGNDHWFYGAQWMREKAKEEIQRLKAHHEKFFNAVANGQCSECGAGAFLPEV